MKRKNDPFSGIKITPQSGKQSFVFDYRPSIKIRLVIQQLAVAVIQGPIARDRIGNAAYVVIQGVLVQREDLPAVLRHLLVEDPEKVGALDRL